MHTYTCICLQRTYTLQSVRLVRHRGIYSLAVSGLKICRDWYIGSRKRKSVGKSNPSIEKTAHFLISRNLNYESNQ